MSLRRRSPAKMRPRIWASSPPQSLVGGVGRAVVPPAALGFAVGLARSLGRVGGADWSASLPGPGSLSGPVGRALLRPATGGELVAHLPRGGVFEGLRERPRSLVLGLVLPPRAAASGGRRCATMFDAVAVPGKNRTGCGGDTDPGTCGSCCCCCCCCCGCSAGCAGNSVSVP